MCKLANFSQYELVCVGSKHAINQIDDEKVGNQQFLAIILCLESYLAVSMKMEFGSSDQCPYSGSELSTAHNQL